MTSELKNLTGSRDDLVGGDNRGTHPPDLAKIYESELAFVCSCLRKFGTEQTELWDLAQEVFVRVLLAPATSFGDRPLRPWLMGIAFRVQREFRRAGTRRALQVEAWTNLPPSPDEILLRKDAEYAVAGALQAIHPSRRAIFELSQLEQRPVSDIARTLQLPINTAHSRLRLARRDFKAALEREGRPPHKED